MTGTALIPLDGQQTGIRSGTEHLAFPIYEEIPIGCLPWPIWDGRHEPHPKDGDFALVDTTDRQIVWGEVFLIAQSKGPILWQIAPETEEWRLRRTAPERPCAWLRPLAGRYSTKESVEEAFRTGRVHLSDGPILLKYLLPQIIGRVIGLYERPKR